MGDGCTAVVCLSQPCSYFCTHSHPYTHKINQNTPLSLSFIKTDFCAWRVRDRSQEDHTGQALCGLCWCLCVWWGDRGLVSTGGRLVTVWVASWKIQLSVVDAPSSEWPNWPFFCRFRKKSTVADSINNLVHRQSLEHFTEGNIFHMRNVFLFYLCSLKPVELFSQYVLANREFTGKITDLAFVGPNVKCFCKCCVTNPKITGLVAFWLSTPKNCCVKRYLERSIESPVKVLGPRIYGKHQKIPAVSITACHFCLELHQ